MSGSARLPVSAGGGRAAAIVFVVVVAIQLALVARAGTDIPFYDQWDVEGRWLYPAWLTDQLSVADLFRPMNEHRVVWTYLLDLGLFIVNGQWDPLLQLAAIALLRGTIAAGLVVAVATGSSRTMAVVGTTVAIAFLPHLAWHSVLWGIESQVYFSIGFSLLALGLLGADERSTGRTLGGLLAGGAALLAMGAGALVAPTLAGWALLRALELRRFDTRIWRLLWPALVLGVAAWLLRVEVSAHAGLGAGGMHQFFVALGQLLSWPHVSQPFAALPLNLPLAAVVIGRIAGRRRAVTGETFVILAAGWSVAVALATAWMRGGSDELFAGVPSRYVDFLVLLPLANVWCVGALAGPIMARWRMPGRILVGAWCGFLLLGWIGLSAEMLRHVVLPRMRDREAPIRLVQEFQRTGNPAVFHGQPRLLVPHPNLGSVSAVLSDPVLAGSLPPSLQPARPIGPLSRAIRWLLRQ